jgi:hypothetical protein
MLYVLYVGESCVRQFFSKFVLHAVSSAFFMNSLATLPRSKHFARLRHRKTETVLYSVFEGVSPNIVR